MTVLDLSFASRSVGAMRVCKRTLQALSLVKMGSTAPSFPIFELSFGNFKENSSQTNNFTSIYSTAFS